MRRFFLTTACLLVVATTAGPGSLAAQEGGTVTGRVSDRATGAGIPRVSVGIAGSAIQTVATDSGFFRLRRVPAGSQTLRAIRIGYSANTTTVVVTEGSTVNADIALTPAATVLTNVVVTATGQEKESREVATFTPTITPDSMNLAASPNFASVLEASAPGVQVTQSSGTLGAGARVRIRGSSSVSLSNEPLYVIDGVEVDNNANGFGPGSLAIAVGGQQPSRLNDINPDDIESLQTLQGPAATGLYGTAAANGVVIITTKHGRPGNPHWDFFVENGELHDQTNYPSNFGSWSKGTLSGPGGGCVIWLAAAGSCHADSITSYNPIHGTLSPLRVGRQQEYDISTSGGSDINAYFASGDYQNETGTDNVNQLIKTTGRGNFTTRPRTDLSLALSTGYTASTTRFPQNDNDVLGVVSDALLGRGAGGPTHNYGYYSSLNPGQTAAIKTFEDVQRFTPSITASYTPLSWLTANATGGFDLVNLDDRNSVVPGIVLFQNFALGEVFRNRLEDETYTVNLNSSATAHLPQSIISTSTIGGSWRRVLNTGSYAFGVGLPGGTPPSLNNASQQIAAQELNQDNRVIGAFFQQQFGWRDVLFLSGGVRIDKNSSTGVAAGTTTYPTGQLSYVISDESWFPKTHIAGTQIIDALKLRVAAGQSGLHPDFLDAIAFKNGVPGISPEGASEPAFTAGNPGNVNLKPERTTEIETGFDLSLINSRLTAGLTYYDKHTSDALIQETLPGSVGDTTFRWINVGKIRNRGLELQMTADVIKMRQADFTVTANFSTLENRLQSLGSTNGQPNPPIIFGLGGATQEHVQGLPLGGYWQLPYTYSDANHDGVIERNEVTVGTTRVYMGSSLPTENASISPQFTLFRIIRLSSLFDFQGGNKLYDGTLDFRCGQFFNCQNDYVKTNLATEAANIADHYDGTVAGFIQDATYWKWREAAISLLLPPEYARKLFARGLTLTFAARNLRVWTKYKGLDPELSEAGQAAASNGFTAADFLTQPPVRYYTFRVTLNY